MSDNFNIPATPAVLVAGTHIHLAAIDTAAIAPYTTEKEARHRLKTLRKRLPELQENLYAEHRQSLLLVFQAMDTGGKDGAIANLLTGINPAGVSVAAFKAPSTEELNHDFLWRIHAQAPRRGHIGVFNRSHYEDVLVVRVHNLVPETTWRTRYADINAFERLLAHNGTRVLKFFLHISKAEQAARLQARLDDPAKRWKYEPGDLKERALWPAYQAAYEEAINHCATPDAPWYVVPADHKWVRDLAIAEIVVAALEEMDPQPPAADFDVAAQVIE